MTVDETCLFKGTDYENCLVAKTSGNNQCETCREGFIPIMWIDLKDAKLPKKMQSL